MHWSASISNEYCSSDNTVTPLPCGVARSCPESGESADISDISSLTTSLLREIPDAACEVEYNPTVLSCAHCKTPASAEHHEGEYTLPAAFSDGLFRTMPVPAGVEFPAGRTRRTKLWGRCLRVDLHTCESVFFRLKLRVIAFFPCLSASEPDFFLVQNASKRFDTDRRNDFFSDKIFPQLFQRPTLKRATQEVRRTFGCFCHKGLVVFGKLCRSTGTGFWGQCLKAAFVEFFNNGSDMVFGVVNKLCNSGNFIALIGGKHHLGPANFDTTGTAAKYPLNLLPFADTEVSGIQTHKKSLSMRNNIELFLRVCLYNTELCIAQVLNM
jgi:hypothetical protein